MRRLRSGSPRTKSHYLAALLIAAVCPAAAEAAPGDLDPSFGRGGVRSIAVPEAPAAMALQPNGSIVVVGSNRRRNADPKPAVARFNPDGHLDEPFTERANRVLSAALSTAADIRFNARDIVIDREGSALLAFAGFSPDSSEAGRLVRLRPDGSADRAFGTEGLVTTRVTSLAIDSRGRVIVAGNAGVSRLLADGTLDPSFAGDGTQDSLPSPPQVVAVAPGDFLLVAGRLTHAFPEQIAVSRLRPDGEPDPAFGENGTAFDQPSSSGGSRHATSVVIDSGGRALVDVQACSPVDLGPGPAVTCGYFVKRFFVDGEPDTEFGTGPFGTTVPGAGLALDRGDRLYSGGRLAPGELFPEAYRLARYKPAGSVDGRFGSGGSAFAYRRYRGGTGTDLAFAAGKLTMLGDGEKDDVLARFETERGPADRDADGLLDADDRCKLFFSHGRPGCPRVRRSAELDARRGRLRVVIASELESCERDELVTLWRRQDGGRERVASGRTKRLGYGVIRFPRPVPAGRYYASSGAHLDRGFGFCRRVRTSTLAVR